MKVLHEGEIALDPALGEADSPAQVIDLREQPAEHLRVERTFEPWRIYRALNVGLVWTDVLCLTSALLLSYFLRFKGVPLSLNYLSVMGVAAVVWIGTFHFYSLYAPWRMAPGEEFRRVVSACSLGVVFIMVASFWSHSELSRIWVGLTWVFALLLQLSTRWLWGRARARLRASGELQLRWPSPDLTDIREVGRDPREDVQHGKQTATFAANLHARVQG